MFGEGNTTEVVQSRGYKYGTDVCRKQYTEGENCKQKVCSIREVGKSSNTFTTKKILTSKLSRSNTRGSGVGLDTPEERRATREVKGPNHSSESMIFVRGETRR